MDRRLVRFLGYRVRSHRAVQDIVPLQVTKKPALLTGVRSQFAKILTQFKKNLFVESAKIGFDKALLRGACTLDLKIKGAFGRQVPGGKESYSVRNPLHSTLNKV